MKKTPKHPMQPVVLDKDGVVRFKPNAIVKFLLDEGPFDQRKLALMSFKRSDWEQFAQLTGYSVSGFGDLPYARKKTVAKADAKVEKLLAKEAK